MAKITVGGTQIAAGSDDQMYGLQEAATAAIEEGGGWLTINRSEEGRGSVVVYVGPGVPVIIEYDRPQIGAIGIY